MQPCAGILAGNFPAPCQHRPLQSRWRTAARLHVRQSSRAACQNRKRWITRAEVISAEEEASLWKPRYNKYLLLCTRSLSLWQTRYSYWTRDEIDRNYWMKWMRISGRDGTVPPATALTTARWFPAWLKYCIVPEFMRYLFWGIWRLLMRTALAVHRRNVLAGMKLDAWLAQKGGRGSEGSVSKAAAMRRWHRNMSLRDSLVYRWKLYKGSCSLADIPPAQHELKRLIVVESDS